MLNNNVCILLKATTTKKNYQTRLAIAATGPNPKQLQSTCFAAKNIIINPIQPKYGLGLVLIQECISHSF